MPKRRQQHPAMAMHGHNNPEKTTVIRTGTYKKKETYEKEARRHENPAKRPPPIKVPPKRVPHPEVTTKKQNSQIRLQEGEHRSGSDSNAHRPRKQSRLRESSERQPEPKPVQQEDYEADLRPENFKGANYGLRTEPEDLGLRASDIKELYQILHDFSRAELRELIIIPLGERLEQGAKYIDLLHLEKGEFVSMADMVAEGEHYYIPKDRTEYVLWNRLRGITTPARLDQPDA